MENNLKINKERQINASLSKVWSILTDPKQMRSWLGVQVESRWEKGNEILFKFSWDGKDYVDKGVILNFEKDSVFSYSYWSELTDLPDEEDHYSQIKFELTQEDEGTKLVLSHSSIVSQMMFEKFNENWDSSLDIIKALAERNG